MQFIINVEDPSEGTALYAAPMEDSEASYLQQAALQLVPISQEQYRHGLAVLFQTAAKYCYVLDEDALFVCIEWQPGLLVIRVSFESTLQWVAIRSPVPNFGGREPLPEDGDPDEYEDDDNPQYSIVYTPWDSQFDREDRKYHGFSEASREVQERFQILLEKLQAAGDNVPKHDHVGFDQWRNECIANLAKESGAGLRL